MTDSKGAPGRSKKIMVVDDADTVADLIREMLISFGYEPEICLGAKEALTKYEVGKFGLVITDYTMPGMNGVEFAKALKEQSPEQSVLLITGSTFSMSDSAAQQMPVNATLQKPFSVMEFEKAVGKFFAIEPAAAGTGA